MGFDHNVIEIGGFSFLGFQFKFYGILGHW